MGNTNVLLDSKAQEIMKDVYHLGGGGGIDYVELTFTNSGKHTTASITEEQMTKLYNGAFIKASLTGGFVSMIFYPKFLGFEYGSFPHYNIGIGVPTLLEFMIIEIDEGQRNAFLNTFNVETTSDGITPPTPPLE